MSRLLPFKGTDEEEDALPAWEEALLVAETWSEISAALAMRSTTSSAAEFGESAGHVDALFAQHKKGS